MESDIVISYTAFGKRSLKSDLKDPKVRGREGGAKRPGT